MNDKQQETWEPKIATMFDSIANSYEKINSLLSCGMDKSWRKLLLKRLQQYYTVNDAILDIGCGPGSLAKMAQQTLDSPLFISSDISLEMLKIASLRNYDMNHHTMALSGMNMPFKEKSFNFIISAFVLRNLSSVEKFYQECYRILKDDGIVIMLDLTHPKSNFFKLGHHYYMKCMIPLIKLFYKTQISAYQYLDQSIKDCIEPKKMQEILTQTSFKNLHLDQRAFGSISIYTAQKIS